MFEETNDDLFEAALPGDEILHHMLVFIDLGAMRPIVALTVHGALISGRAISELEYLEDFVAQHNDPKSEVSEMFVWRYKQRILELKQDRRKNEYHLDKLMQDGFEAVDQQVKQLVADTIYIHLKDVTISAGDGASTEAEFWRCYLGDVDGFSVRSSSTSATE